MFVREKKTTSLRIYIILKFQTNNTGGGYKVRKVGGYKVKWSFFSAPNGFFMYMVTEFSKSPVSRYRIEFLLSSVNLGCIILDSKWHEHIIFTLYFTHAGLKFYNVNLF